MDTIAALRKAVTSPNLAAPGGCEYVNDLGHHCIVGQVLSDLGVSDDVLGRGVNEHDGSANTAFIGNRSDLNSFFEDHELDVNLLRKVQFEYDYKDNFSGDPIYTRESFAAYLDSLKG